MEKKLTAQGPKDRKSYTVTLPIEWVKKEKLDKTKSVELNIVGDKIVISPFKEVKDRVLISGEEYSKSVIKVLPGLYRAGVNEIKLTFTNNQLVEQVIEIIEKRLIGYEIVEQKNNYLIIKDITKESEEEFKVIFRRIFLLLLQLSESKDIIQIRTLDRNIKKLTNYCQRILMKKGFTEFTKTPIYYLVLDRLEKLNDEYNWILQIKLTKKKNISTLKELNRLLRETYELFYKFDSKRFDENQYKSYQLKNKIKIESTTDKAKVHLHNLARIINSLHGEIFILRFDENKKTF